MTDETSETSCPLTIAVLTYRRPADLRALLPMLVEQVENAGVGYPIEILVVDNDPQGTGREVVAECRSGQIRYVVETRPGIAAARNRALREARHADRLIFIDDDERPRETWLRMLLATADRYGADAVAGRVVSRFERQPSRWVIAGGFFSRRSHVTGARLSVAATNNLLLDMRMVRSRGLTFDERFSTSGGEDTVFTKELVRAGGSIVWCNEAVVYDVVPASRATSKFVIKRAMSHGTLHSRVGLETAGSRRERARVRIQGIAGGSVRVLGGLARWFVGALSSSISVRARSVRTMLRGIGMIVGAVGHIPAQYVREDTMHKIIVLQSFPDPTSTTNPYISMLADALGATNGVELLTFSWRRALTSRYGVFHAHWPESLMHGRTRIRTYARQLLFAALLLRIALRRTAVVRTMHNIELPRDIDRRTRWMLRQLDRLTTVRIRLNRWTASGGGPHVTILHGHYKDWFAQYPISDSMEGKLVFVGLVRRYKNIPGLIDAFGDIEDDSLRLTIAGHPSRDYPTAAVTAQAKADPRISIDFRRLSDAEFVDTISSAEMVVLPYEEMHNSGTVLAALSIGRPVLVPRTPINQELAAETGPGWVYTYDGDFSAAAIVDSLSALRSDVGRRSALPNLDNRDWSQVGALHAEAYVRSINLTRPNGERSNRTGPFCAPDSGHPSV